LVTIRILPTWLQSGGMVREGTPFDGTHHPGVPPGVKPRRVAGLGLGLAVVAVACAAVLLVLPRAPAGPGELLSSPAKGSLAATAKAALDKLEGKKVRPEGSLAATAKAALDQLEGKKVKADKGRATTGRGAGPADEAGKPASPPAATAAAAKAAAVKKAAAAVKEAAPPMVSASEVHKIMKTMIKAAAKKKQDRKATESKTDRMQDRILRAKNKLAMLKLKKSQDFAKYEKSHEEVDDAKSKALQAHDEYQEDMERERSYEKRLDHLKQKLANHLTGSTARTDLNEYYAHLNNAAVKSIPKKIRVADMQSTREAALYKNRMEQHEKALAAGARGRTAGHRRLDTKRTVSLKAFPQVNVWDTKAREADVVDSAEKKLDQVSKAADREILKSEERKGAKAASHH